MTCELSIFKVENAACYIIDRINKILVFSLLFDENSFSFTFVVLNSKWIITGKDLLGSVGIMEALFIKMP